MKKLLCRIACLLLCSALLANTTHVGACGPSYIQPVFVSLESPDPPFTNFVAGQLGIVKPTFGRKTLVIAYRYLNGGAFTANDQAELVDALNVRRAGNKKTDSLQSWLKARKELLREGESLPGIYAARTYGGYDFFPNCTGNAFEVATETLKDRIGRFGADDLWVRKWISGQDTVFANCSSSGGLPPEVGGEAPEWLKKDRDYQIAAALFYSMNFDKARERFAKIADDSLSAWQDVAAYLVVRTLVRQASLTTEEKKKSVLYEEAEAHAVVLAQGSSKYAKDADNLLGLIRYRNHPEERVRELARVLSYDNGDPGLYQHLIDYTWLLDKIESQAIKEAEERRKAANPEPEPSASVEVERPPEDPDILRIFFSPKQSNGENDYSNAFTLNLRYDLPEADVIIAAEEILGRHVSDAEREELLKTRTYLLESRRWLQGPNRKLDLVGYDHVRDYSGEKLPIEHLPVVLRADDLSTWVLAVGRPGRQTYKFALKRWRQSNSEAWLIVALMNAEKNSIAVDTLMRQAAKISADSPASPSVIYHLARLQISLGRIADARQLLDKALERAEELPLSAQNQLVALRMQAARSVDEFLKFAVRTPIGFWEGGNLGSISELLQLTKLRWNPEWHQQTKEEYERQVQENFEELLEWENRRMFDEESINTFNWHIPLSVLVPISRSPSLSTKLRTQIALMSWTRAILLQNEDAAQDAVRSAVTSEPKFTPVFESYLRAESAAQREREALFILLRWPSLSPFLREHIRQFSSGESMDYYLEEGWWCKLSETTYNEEGNEVPLVITKPGFVNAQQLQAAQKEREQLISIGDAAPYLGKRVLKWAQDAPNDPRVPEALFIAAQANSQYRYGCNGQEYDRPLKEEIEALMRNNYPKSAWTVRLNPVER